MDKGMCFLGGLGLGAGLMYLLDPSLGRRRRHILRDKALSRANQVEHFLESAWCDARHRAEGLAAETRSMLRHEEIPDQKLEARVRSELGRCCSHPRSIHVVARDGQVTLTGPVLADEVDDVIAGVRSVRGVCEIVSHLQLQQAPGSVPGLQGPRRGRRNQFELLQQNWSPAARLLTTSAGAVLLGYGLTGRFPTACVAGTVGLALMTRGISNTDLATVGKRLVATTLATTQHDNQSIRTCEPEPPQQRIAPSPVAAGH